MKKIFYQCTTFDARERYDINFIGYTEDGTFVVELSHRNRKETLAIIDLSCFWSAMKDLLKEYLKPENFPKDPGLFRRACEAAAADQYTVEHIHDIEAEYNRRREEFKNA